MRFAQIYFKLSIDKTRMGIGSDADRPEFESDSDIGQYPINLKIRWRLSLEDPNRD